MYTARVVKPKLSLSISAAQSVPRPTLSLKSPGPIPRTPVSPISASSPSSMRFSSLQVPSYAYTNSCSSKSILKKQSSSRTATVDKRIQFQVTPTVHCVTPIENPDEYYGKHMKMSREERRWTVRHRSQGRSLDDYAASRACLDQHSSALNARRCLTSRRGLLTLAIETSCDDTSVAIVEKTKKDSGSAAKIHFLENVTADTRAHRGIHPIIALESHQDNLANLVQRALNYLPESKTSDGLKLADGTRRRLPDFISATRGPGMRSNLSVGLDTGKALSVAWQIPMVGVHHMQAHLLTPGLVSSLENEAKPDSPAIVPEFPFLSILVSGGHTTLVQSKGLTDHRILATSEDIAIGEALDKSARDILPESFLQEAKTTMYGKILEQFVFPNGKADFADYSPPESRGKEITKRVSDWGWSLTTPFANTRIMQFSFSSISSMVGKIVQSNGMNIKMSHTERVDLGREAMRVCFEHLASRTVIALDTMRPHNNGKNDINTIVVSGGVAANQFLMKVLTSFLEVRGFGNIKIVAPPPYLCTDNAAMIGWAGIEMFEAGFRSDLDCRPLRKWTLDPRADDGGILGPGGWIQE
ncbi:Kae1/YgjD family [Penicillium vulpinum]|uniref:Kae1/YgjD family n=1 Tax=Penicillium vulpinum TaxID=29845 RepID=UPI002546F875|nr:Kae1/YgjD family [Penicillium vulpinum]KAJ5958981.1 Kae1/YgjD family [Penicillium vulpinum]